MTNKLVSIIIPTFNRSKFLIETLESIRMQSYDAFECIIIDDGSTENEKNTIRKYVEKHSNFSFIERPKELPKGANSCRNYGFNLARGYYITWFDDDDIMLPNSIKDRVYNFDEEKIMVISTGSIVDENLNNPELINLTISSNLFKDYAMMRLLVLTPSILFKKSYLESKKLFCLKIARGQETEFFCRLFYSIKKEEYKLINTSYFLYRRHANSKTTKNYEYVKSYKESLSFISIENLKRGLALNDNDIVSKYYSILINNFFRGLEKNHLKLEWYILKHLPPLIRRNNLYLSLHFFLFGTFFIIINRGSFKFEKYYKSRQIIIS